MADWSTLIGGAIAIAGGGITSLFTLRHQANAAREERNAAAAERAEERRIAAEQRADELRRDADQRRATLTTALWTAWAESYAAAITNGDGNAPDPATLKAIAVLVAAAAALASDIGPAADKQLANLHTSASELRSSVNLWDWEDQQREYSLYRRIQALVDAGRDDTGERAGGDLDNLATA